MNQSTQNHISSTNCGIMCLQLPLTIKKTLKNTKVQKRKIQSNSCLKLSKNFTFSIFNPEKPIKPFSRPNVEIGKVSFLGKAKVKNTEQKCHLKINQQPHQTEFKKSIGLSISLAYDQSSKNMKINSANAQINQKQFHQETQKTCLQNLKTPQIQLLLTPPSTDRSQTSSFNLVPSTLQIPTIYSLSQALSARTNIISSSQVSNPPFNNLSESIVIESYTNDPSFWK